MRHEIITPADICREIESRNYVAIPEPLRMPEEGIQTFNIRRASPELKKVCPAGEQVYAVYYGEREKDKDGNYVLPPIFATHFVLDGDHAVVDIIVDGDHVASDGGTLAFSQFEEKNNPHAQLMARAALHCNQPIVLVVVHPPRREPVFINAASFH